MFLEKEAAEVCL